MINNKTLLHLTILISLIFSPTLIAQNSEQTENQELRTQEIEGNKKEAENAKAINDRLSQIEQIKTGNPLIDRVVELYTTYIREVLASTRGLQNAVFEKANMLIETSIAYMETDEYQALDKRQKEEYGQWQKHAMNRLLNMVVLSSDEGTVDNDKQFSTIEPRLTKLHEVMVKIHESKNANTQKIRMSQFNSIANDTASDYELLRRFNAGIGISYNYLPEVTYSGVLTTPLRNYLTQQNADYQDPFNSNRFELGSFQQSFSNTSYPTVNLSVRMGFLAASVGLPFYDKTTMVQASDSVVTFTESNQRLVASNVVETEFKPLFDINISLSVFDLCKEIREHFYTTEWTGLGSKLTHQFDMGLVLGMSAFQLKDKYTSDIRMVENGMSFNDSPSLDMLVTQTERNLRPVSYGIYFRLEPTDTLTLGVDVKYFDNDTDGDFTVDVDGTTVTAHITYFFM